MLRLRPKIDCRFDTTLALSFSQMRLRFMYSQPSGQLI
jgi:hypothetical protein